MTIKKIILISVLSICFSAQSIRKKIIEDYKCIEWINDKNGCDGTRKLEYAQSIIKQRNILNGSEPDFVRIFGTPDNIEEDLNSKMLFYYTDSSCNNGEIIKDSDVCFIIFYFKNNRFTEISMRCE